MTTTATKEINQDLFKRFARHCRTDNIAYCSGCPHAAEYTVTEKLPESVHSAYRNLPNFKDGKLFTTRHKPNINSAPCGACFQGWYDHNKEQGNICIKCQKWAGRDRGIEIVTTEVWADNLKEIKTTSTICRVCSLKALNNLIKNKHKPVTVKTSQ